MARLLNYLLSKNLTKVDLTPGCDLGSFDIE